jgi:hypothetical protein
MLGYSPGYSQKRAQGPRRYYNRSSVSYPPPPAPSLVRLLTLAMNKAQIGVCLGTQSELETSSEARRISNKIPVARDSNRILLGEVQTASSDLD